MIGDLNILLLVTDRKRKQKMHMVIEDLTNMINKFDRTDICKTLQYKSVEYIFFFKHVQNI